MKGRTPQPDELLTLTEAEYGSGISRFCWYKLARRGQVESKRGTNRKLMIPLREVARLVASGYRPRRGRPVGWRKRAAA